MENCHENAGTPCRQTLTKCKNFPVISNIRLMFLKATIFIISMKSAVLTLSHQQAAQIFIIWEYDQRCDEAQDTERKAREKHEEK